MRMIRVLALAAMSALALAACAPVDSTSTSTSTSASTSSGTLPTLTAGKLTIGTSDPGYAPWVVDNTPSNGKGFESAVAYAVAKKLGFAATDVVWVPVSF